MIWKRVILWWMTLLALVFASAGATAAPDVSPKSHVGAIDLVAAICIEAHGLASADGHQGNWDAATTGTSDVPHAARGASQGWKLGGFKSAAKWESQMAKRGWTPEQISQAIQKGEKFAAENLVNKGNAATRYVHPETGRSVVVDNVTKEVIHVGGTGFKY